jgi:hypothetical protein
MIAGVKDIADLLTYVKSGMSDCSSLKADWAKLVQMAQIFSSPSSFAYHVGKDLIINGKDIYREIRTAITDYKNGAWSDFGYQIGEASAKLILGETNELATLEKKAQMVQFLKGFFDNYNIHIDVVALL